MPFELRINLSEIDAFADKLYEFEGAVQAEQIYAMEAGISVLEQAITVRTPVNFGTARQAWTHQITGTPANLLGEVFNPLEYALPLELGRRPGKQPPTSAIELWVTRKLGLSGSEARNTAYLIARAIGRRGTQGAFMLRDGWAEAEPIIIRLFEAIPEKAMARLQ